jgi:hypothetical protein
MADVAKKFEPDLLLEYRVLNYNRNLIKEAIEQGGPVILSGVFQEAGTLNQNGRIYPKEILEREVMKFQDAIRENRAYGALDHPDSSIVELSNAAVLIKELGWNGNQVVGKLEVLDTSKGKDLIGCLKSGGSVGISSRAFGSTHRSGEGNEIVNEDLSLITFDAVASPSVAKAILSESYRPRQNWKPIDRHAVVHELLDSIIAKY